MKNRGRLVILATLIVACLAGTAIVFLTINKINPDRLKEGVFWFAFAFAVPVNLIVAIGLHVWSGHRGGKDIVHMPVAYYVIAVFGAAYLIAGLIFMYGNFTQWTLPVIVEIIITAAYIIVGLYVTFAADYVSNTQREVKEKVLYIRMLQADVNDCRAKSSSAAVNQALARFAQNVECSDPMSHASLVGIESSLTSAVARISSALSTEESEEEILKMIADAEALLDSRNRRCIMLK